MSLGWYFSFRLHTLLADSALVRQASRPVWFGAAWQQLDDGMGGRIGQPAPHDQRPIACISALLPMLMVVVGGAHCWRFRAAPATSAFRPLGWHHQLCTQAHNKFRRAFQWRTTTTTSKMAARTLAPHSRFETRERPAASHCGGSHTYRELFSRRAKIRRASEFARVILHRAGNLHHNITSYQLKRSVAPSLILINQ